MKAPRPRSADMYSDSFMLHTVAPSFDDCKHYATDKSSKMLRMKTIAEIRYDNLLTLVNTMGGGDLTEMLKKSKSWHLESSENKLSRPTIDQILKRRTTANGVVKNVGDDLARKIEDELRLETGWMDNIHDERDKPSRAAPGVGPDEISKIVSVYCFSDAIHRQSIMAAVDVAADLLLANATRKRDYL